MPQVDGRAMRSRDDRRLQLRQRRDEFETVNATPDGYESPVSKRRCLHRRRAARSRFTGAMQELDQLRLPKKKRRRHYCTPVAYQSPGGCRYASGSNRKYPQTFSPAGRCYLR
ncbi:hypothetical protein JG688_00012744 [Phytophthora aleatoria]|uniref:Uncharacterized protein n=1 Tax=Phytophthora aleatoria TaxID=2496075 RepID=A0A8J5J2D7_9STRA|nr:hypothetical protein JG688_00012744 [Phytophthora aleatoria]